MRQKFYTKDCDNGISSDTITFLIASVKISDFKVLGVCQHKLQGLKSSPSVVFVWFGLVWSEVVSIGEGGQAGHLQIPIYNLIFNSHTERVSFHFSFLWTPETAFQISREAVLEFKKDYTASKNNRKHSVLQ